MTSYRTKDIRDLIAALQQVVREHGSDHHINVVEDADGDEGGTVFVMDCSGGHVAQIHVGCVETDRALLPFVQQIPHARRKTRQQHPR